MFGYLYFLGDRTMNSQSKTNMKRVFSYTLVVFSALVSCVSAFAIASVDPAFAPVPSKAISTPNSISQLVQPDGKVVVWGADLVVDGIGKGQIARLNADGTVDSSFSYCGCLLTSVTNVGLQPDGKLLVAGSTGQSRMVRLNADGTQDNTFVANYSIGVGSTFEFVAIQADSKILVTSFGSFGNGFHAGYLIRVNPDGTIDSGFTPFNYDNGRTTYGSVAALVLVPGGKIYMSITSSSFTTTIGSLKRYNEDGTVDPSWEQPNFTSGSGNTAYVSGLDLQADGLLVAGGRFDSVNGVSKANFVRLMTAGNVDLNFTPPSGMASGGGRVKVLSNGKILAGFNTTGIGRLTRLNSDGSQDNTFVLSPTVDQLLNRWVVDTAGRIIFLGISNTQSVRFFRLNADGDVDASYNPNVTVFGQIYAVAAQTNGKTIISGTFSQINGIARPGIARVNADGTQDATFDPGTGFNGTVSRIIVQADGKILCAGGFTMFNGTAQSYLVRLNANGTLDTAFNPTVTTVNTPPVTDISLQADQKILMVGYFSAVNGTSRTGIARLNSDGSVDTGFTPLVSTANIFSAVQQPDGKVIVGGSFTGVDGFNRSNLVRLNTNGGLDQTFNATSMPSVNKIVIQPDGKYLCITGAGSPTGMTRRNIDGTNDTSFVAPSFVWSSSSDMYLYSMVVQSDGSIIVGGRFNTVNSIARNCLVRLRPNGAVDPLFFPNGANAAVRDMALQTNGNLLVGGEFSRIANSTRVGIARIIPGLFVGPVLFDYDGDGKADVSVFRASTNQWYILRSSDFGVTQTTFAIAGDIPTPADFDGDGRTDMTIFRPSSGDWWSLSTINNQQINTRWGQAGDIPLPSDFDGDGRMDYVIFRPSNNQWLRIANNGTTANRVFGLAGDKPVIGDFDGDGKSDVAIYRPSDGNWWWQSSVDNVQRATKWGISTDIPAPADYDGDGKTDFAVFRPSTGVWYIYNSATQTSTIGPFGLSGDKPVPADFDGDGKADIAVYRPSDGIWYLLRSTAGFTGFRFGISTDVPTENAFVP